MVKTNRSNKPKLLEATKNVYRKIRIPPIRYA